MIESLMVELPSSATDEAVAILHLHHGLGLGLVLARLFEERFVDIAGTQVGFSASWPQTSNASILGFQGMISVWKAVYELENVSFGSFKNR
jgi:hypothetical protein